MGPQKKNHFWRWVFLSILLAALCLGGAELAFCRVKDPALFAALTAPVTTLARDAGDAIARRWDGLTRAVAGLFARPEEGEPIQLAGEPAIQEPLPPVDPVITELTTVGGQELLTGGNVRLVYYCQKDEAWVEQRYGSDPIGKYGCGPTALSMLVSSLTDHDVDPAEMAAWAVQAGCWAPRGGSYLSIVERAADEYGLECRSLTERTVEELEQALVDGAILVALVGPGHFTTNGHFILIHGITLSGQVLVADPNSRENSLAPWDPELVLSELSANRSSGGPLWALSVPSEF